MRKIPLESSHEIIKRLRSRINHWDSQTEKKTISTKSRKVIAEKMYVLFQLLRRIYATRHHHKNHESQVSVKPKTLSAGFWEPVPHRNVYVLSYGSLLSSMYSMLTQKKLYPQSKPKASILLILYYKVFSSQRSTVVSQLVACGYVRKPAVTELVILTGLFEVLKVW